MSAGAIIAPACHIFVLEDKATTRAVITHLLTHNLRCRVSAFATPGELWAACADQQPDLFLLDIIPEGSVTGIDVCNRLRGNEATRHIPIIFLSVHNQPQTRTQALRSGGVDYVDKPFTPRNSSSASRASSSATGTSASLPRRPRNRPPSFGCSATICVIPRGQACRCLNKSGRLWTRYSAKNTWIFASGPPARLSISSPTWVNIARCSTERGPCKWSSSTSPTPATRP